MVLMKTSKKFLVFYNVLLFFDITKEVYHGTCISLNDYAHIYLFIISKPQISIVLRMGEDKLILDSSSNIKKTLKNFFEKVYYIQCFYIPLIYSTKDVCVCGIKMLNQ